MQTISMNIVTQGMNNNKFGGSVQPTFLVFSPVVVESMVCVCGWVGGCVCGYVSVHMCGWMGVNHVELGTCHC